MFASSLHFTLFCRYSLCSLPCRSNLLAWTSTRFPNKQRHCCSSTCVWPPGIRSLTPGSTSCSAGQCWSASIPASKPDLPSFPSTLCSTHHCGESLPRSLCFTRDHVLMMAASRLYGPSPIRQGPLAIGMEEQLYSDIPLTALTFATGWKHWEYVFNPALPVLAPVLLCLSVRPDLRRPQVLAVPICLNIVRTIKMGFSKNPPWV